MKSGSYKFSSRNCCLIKSVCRQYKCLQRTYFQQQKEKRQREILVGKRLRRKMEKKSGEETSVLLGDTNISYSRHTARLSYQKNFHIHTEKYIYMCTGRPKKEGSVTIYYDFYLRCSSPISGHIYRIGHVAVLYRPHKDTFAFILHVIHFIPI